MASSTLIGIQLAGCLDDKKANGGQGSIAEQIAASGVDVVLGGGLQYFQETAEGTDLTVLQQAEQQGYQVVTKGSDLASVAFDRKLLGLFAASTLPVLYTGDNAAHGKAQLVSDEQGSTQIPEPFHCIPNPKFTGTPTLKEMTETALRHLHQNTDRGFFLMVESASIDKQSHYRQPCGHIGETLQLNEALDTALAFAEKVPNTLVLVTADHSQAAQLVSEISPYLSPENTSVHSPGYFARVITREGGVMGVNYATTTFPMMEEHTGAQVPLFAGGSAIDQVHIPTAVNQPDIFTIMAEYLGLLPNRATLNSR